jgi:hypothetical protein
MISTLANSHRIEIVAAAAECVTDQVSACEAVMSTVVATDRNGPPYTVDELLTARITPDPVVATWLSLIQNAPAARCDDVDACAWMIACSHHALDVEAPIPSDAPDAHNTCDPNFNSMLTVRFDPEPFT